MEGYYFWSNYIILFGKVNWFCMNESTGKSNSIHNKQYLLIVAIMTEKGRQATQFQLLLAINYSFCDDIAPIWSNGQGPMTFDTFPKVQVLLKKYIIGGIEKKWLITITKLLSVNSNEVNYVSSHLPVQFIWRLSKKSYNILMLISEVKVSCNLSKKLFILHLTCRLSKKKCYFKAILRDVMEE